MTTCSIDDTNIDGDLRSRRGFTKTTLPLRRSTQMSWFDLSSSSILRVVVMIDVVDVETKLDVCTYLPRHIHA